MATIMSLSLHSKVHKFTPWNWNREISNVMAGFLQVKCFWAMMHVEHGCSVWKPWSTNEQPPYQCSSKTQVTDLPLLVCSRKHVWPPLHDDEQINCWIPTFKRKQHIPKFTNHRSIFWETIFAGKGYLWATEICQTFFLQRLWPSKPSVWHKKPGTYHPSSPKLALGCALFCPAKWAPTTCK